MKTALSKSRNIVAAKVITDADITPEKVVQYAHLLGITSQLDANPSLALGTSSASPLEMCSAYCPFANGGISRQPLLIKYIENAQGRTLKEFSSKSSQVVDAQSIYLVVDMLRDAVENGSGRSVRSLGFNRPAAGKTGTSQEARDAWFIGFTPDLVTAIWVGFDDNRPIKDQNGIELSSAVAIPIWVHFMKNALQGQRYRNFPVPEGIIFAFVDPATGEIVPQDYPNAQQVALKAGTQLPMKHLAGNYYLSDSTNTIPDSLKKLLEDFD